jgi:formylglycine-generating enzyme
MMSRPFRASLTLALLVVVAACGSRATDDAAGARPGGEPDPHQHASSATAPHRQEGASAIVGVHDAPPPGPAPESMVWVPGGTFWRGCDDCGMWDTQPVHLVSVDGFWMDRAPVTNAQFASFVEATRYVTVAERKPNPADFPGVPAHVLVPGSAVFRATGSAVPLDSPQRWWTYVAGASWKHPEGPGSSTRGRADHPVVHVAYEDAVAYGEWAGKRLPTEAEFEFAARGGLDRNRYAWGNEMRPGGKPVANTWQGRFPARDAAEDGYAGTSPVTAFPPNGFGLYDMGGNVWQWCADWYRPDYYATLAGHGGVAHNPTGPETSLDPDEPGAAKRVVRGGSFLCSDEYCVRFLVGSRGKSEVSSSLSNLGIRLVRSPAGAP